MNFRVIGHIILQGRAVLMVVLLISILWACAPSHVSDTNATINMLIDSEETNTTSVTGKELLWSKSQIKWRDSTGRVQFKANVIDADLLQIKCDNSYTSVNCYLESGQTINVIYKDHDYRYVGNSIAARQNRFLVETAKRRALWSAGRLKNVNDPESSMSFYLSEQQLITTFADGNSDASLDFITFAHFDNRYYYLQSLLGSPSLESKTYYHFNEKELELLKNTIDDSDYQYAYLSKSYRIMLNNYTDYRRLNDTAFLQLATDNPIQNEIILSRDLKHKELQEYFMALSLQKLFAVDCQLDIEDAIKQYTGYWQKYLLEEYHTVQTRDDVNHGVIPEEIRNLDFDLTTSVGEHINVKDYRGNWIYLEINKNLTGYSPYEAYFLEHLNSKLPQLQCMFVSASKLEHAHKSYHKILLTYTSMESLEENFKTDLLPFSVLINPEGNLVAVNLPKASTGMLEPMLRYTMKSN